MGHTGKIWHRVVQERKITWENERRRVQEKNKEGIGQANVRKEEKERTRTQGNRRILQTTVRSSEALWRERAREKVRIPAKNWFIKKNEGPPGERRVKAQKSWKEERRSTWPPLGLKDQGINISRITISARPQEKVAVTIPASDEVERGKRE